MSQADRWAQAVDKAHTLHYGEGLSGKVSAGVWAFLMFVAHTDIGKRVLLDIADEVRQDLEKEC